MIDTFSNQFYFLSVNQKDSDTLRTYHNRLNNIYEDSLNNQDTILVIMDASIKNNVATSVFYIWKDHNIIIKSIHYTMNVNSTEVELFAMKLQDVSKVVVITDAIPATKWIFNTSIYPYQLHFITILENLREFFNKNPNNSISFWDCPNNIK